MRELDDMEMALDSLSSEAIPLDELDRLWKHYEDLCTSIAERDNEMDRLQTGLKSTTEALNQANNVIAVLRAKLYAIGLLLRD